MNQDRVEVDSSHSAGRVFFQGEGSHSLIRFTPVIFSIFHSGSNPNSLMEWESFNRIASGKANRRVPQD